VSYVHTALLTGISSCRAQWAGIEQDMQMVM